jgi:phage gp16-like protein
LTISKERKAVIHVAKSQLAMTDEDYRALLLRAAGVGSSSELDDAGFTKLMSEFERLGFRSAKSRTQATHRKGMATPAQIGKIRALWKSYSGNDDELRMGHWLEKTFHVSNVRFLEDWRAGKVIAVLEKMAAWARDKKSMKEAADVRA